jgi:hypothetical protein
VVTGSLEHVIGRDRVSPNHTESDLAHVREIAADLRAPGEACAVFSGRERAIGDSAKLEALASGREELAVDCDPVLGQRHPTGRLEVDRVDAALGARGSVGEAAALRGGIGRFWGSLSSPDPAHASHILRVHPGIGDSESRPRLDTLDSLRAGCYYGKSNDRPGRFALMLRFANPRPRYRS